jgi:hypothetical protein
MTELIVCLSAICVMGYLVARVFYKYLYLPSSPSQILNLDKSEANRRD